MQLFSFLSRLLCNARWNPSHACWDQLPAPENTLEYGLQNGNHQTISERSPPWMALEACNHNLHLHDTLRRENNHCSLMMRCGLDSVNDLHMMKGMMEHVSHVLRNSRVCRMEWFLLVVCIWEYSSLALPRCCYRGQHRMGSCLCLLFDDGHTLIIGIPNVIPTLMIENYLLRDCDPHDRHVHSHLHDHGHHVRILKYYWKQISYFKA